MTLSSKGKKLCQWTVLASLCASTVGWAETDSEAQAAVSRQSGQTPGLAGSVEQGRGVVQINGVVISYATLDRAVSNYIQQRQIDPVQAAKGSPVYKGIRQSVLNEFVGQELLWQEASRTNNISSEQQVEQALQATIERFPDQASFVTNLKASGFTEASFTQDLTQRLSVEMLVNTQIVSKIVVSDEETKAFYAANTASFTRPEQFRARHILISPAADGGEEAKAQARATLDKIHAQLQAGTDFAALAEQHSQGPSGPRGGDLGLVTRGQLVPSFEAAALALSVGEVSGPIETPYGYHLIKLEQYQPAEAIPEQQALGMIKQRLRSIKIGAAIEAWTLELWDAGRVELMGPV